MYMGYTGQFLVQFVLNTNTSSLSCFQWNMRGSSFWWLLWRTLWKSTPGLPNLTTSSWPLRYGGTNVDILDTLHDHFHEHFHWSDWRFYCFPLCLSLSPLLNTFASLSASLIFSSVPCVSLSVIHWAAAPSPAGWPHGGRRPEVKGHLRLQRGLPRHRRGLGQPLRHLHPLTCKCSAMLGPIWVLLNKALWPLMNLNEDRHTCCKVVWEKQYFSALLSHFLVQYLLIPVSRSQGSQKDKLVGI